MILCQSIIELFVIKHTDIQEYSKVAKMIATINQKQEIVFKKDKATLHVTSKICENTVNYYN